MFMQRYVSPYGSAPTLSEDDNACSLQLNLRYSRLRATVSLTLHSFGTYCLRVHVTHGMSVTSVGTVSS